MIYIELFLTFFIIGMFTIGGGYAMLSLIQNEVVTVHGWITWASYLISLSLGFLVCEMEVVIPPTARRSDGKDA